MKSKNQITKKIELKLYQQKNYQRNIMNIYKIKIQDLYIKSQYENLKINNLWMNIANILLPQNATSFFSIPFHLETFE